MLAREPRTRGPGAGTTARSEERDFFSERTWCENLRPAGRACGQPCARWKGTLATTTPGGARDGDGLSAKSHDYVTPAHQVDGEARQSRIRDGYGTCSSGRSRDGGNDGNFRCDSRCCRRCFPGTSGDYLGGGADRVYLVFPVKLGYPPSSPCRNPAMAAVTSSGWVTFEACGASSTVTNVTGPPRASRTASARASGIAVSAVPCTINAGQVISARRPVMSSRSIRHRNGQFSWPRSSGAHCAYCSVHLAYQPSHWPGPKMIEATTSCTGPGPWSSQAWCICSYPGAAAGSSWPAWLSISTSARTRSGAISAARSDTKPPWDMPASTARSRPRWSSRASTSAAESQ